MSVEHKSNKPGPTLASFTGNRFGSLQLDSPGGSGANPKTHFTVGQIPTPQVQENFPDLNINNRPSEVFQKRMQTIFAQSLLVQSSPASQTSFASQGNDSLQASNQTVCGSQPSNASQATNASQSQVAGNTTSPRALEGIGPAHDVPYMGTFEDLPVDTNEPPFKQVRHRRRTRKAPYGRQPPNVQDVETNISNIPPSRTSTNTNTPSAPGSRTSTSRPAQQNAPSSRLIPTPVQLPPQNPAQSQPSAATYTSYADTARVRPPEPRVPPAPRPKPILFEYTNLDEDEWPHDIRHSVLFPLLWDWSVFDYIKAFSQLQCLHTIVFLSKHYRTKLYVLFKSLHMANIFLTEGIVLHGYQVFPIPYKMTPTGTELTVSGVPGHIPHRVVLDHLFSVCVPCDNMDFEKFLIKPLRLNVTPEEALEYLEISHIFSMKRVVNIQEPPAPLPAKMQIAYRGGTVTVHLSATCQKDGDGQGAYGNQNENRISHQSVPVSSPSLNPGNPTVSARAPMDPSVPKGQRTHSTQDTKVTQRAVSHSLASAGQSVPRAQVDGNSHTAIEATDQAHSHVSTSPDPSNVSAPTGVPGVQRDGNSQTVNEATDQAYSEGGTTPVSSVTSVFSSNSSVVINQSELTSSVSSATKQPPPLVKVQLGPGFQDVLNRTRGSNRRYSQRQLKHRSPPSDPTTAPKTPFPSAQLVQGMDQQLTKDEQFFLAHRGISPGFFVQKFPRFIGKNPPTRALGSLKTIMSQYTDDDFSALKTLLALPGRFDRIPTTTEEIQNTTSSTSAGDDPEDPPDITLANQMDTSAPPKSPRRKRRTPDHTQNSPPPGQSNTSCASPQKPAVPLQVHKKKRPTDSVSSVAASSLSDAVLASDTQCDMDTSQEVTNDDPSLSQISASLEIPYSQVVESQDPSPVNHSSVVLDPVPPEMSQPKKPPDPICHHSSVVLDSVPPDISQPTNPLDPVCQTVSQVQELLTQSTHVDSPPAAPPDLQKPKQPPDLGADANTSDVVIVLKDVPPLDGSVDPLSKASQEAHLTRETSVNSTAVNSCGFDETLPPEPTSHPTSPSSLHVTFDDSRDPVPPPVIVMSTPSADISPVVRLVKCTTPIRQGPSPSRDGQACVSPLPSPPFQTPGKSPPSSLAAADVSPSLVFSPLPSSTSSTELMHLLPLPCFNGPMRERFISIKSLLSSYTPPSDSPLSLANVCHLFAVASYSELLLSLLKPMSSDIPAVLAQLRAIHSHFPLPGRTKGAFIAMINILHMHFKSS